MRAIEDLLEKWKDEGKLLRERYALDSAARICDAHVRELMEAIEAARNECLTVDEAAIETGYSPQHLRSLLSDGAIPNSGEKGRPRIRRSDLPVRKVRTAAAKRRRLQKAGTPHSAGERKKFDARKIVRRA